MGYYRLFLALCVVFSHTAFQIGFNVGKSAVIGFFLISGHAMYNLVNKKYSSLGGIFPFYIDRALRIYPLYIFFAAISILWILFNAQNIGFHQSCTPELMGLNVAIVPLYFQIAPWHLCTLLPQSWSLSLELVFYVVLPFIIIFWNRWVVLAIFTLSVSVYLQAYLGIIDTDHYAYRHLSGTLYIFLIGMSFACEGLFWGVFRWSAWMCSVILFVIMFSIPSLWELNSNREIVIGLLIGIPSLELSRKMPSSKIERFSGNLSYAVFLSHYLVYLVVTQFFHLDYGVKLFSIVAIISFIIGSISHIYIEKPIMTRFGRRRDDPQPAIAVVI
ncbi:acyltransferase family protein [Pleomorphomonas sp. PLEO]|uniref:acyltransferase family protein n=1 Tax=Pleomorphomonas sp. PLEO TaxID=3239306 RepID=UPI00351F0B34